MGTMDQQLTLRGESMRKAGFWVDKTMDDFLAQALKVCPDKDALIAYRIDRDLPVRMTYRQLADRVNRAAAALHRLGVRHGDVNTGRFKFLLKGARPHRAGPHASVTGKHDFLDRCHD